jgi:hypothetical protein
MLVSQQMNTPDVMNKGVLKIDPMLIATVSELLLLFEEHNLCAGQENPGLQIFDVRNHCSNVVAFKFSR